MEQLQLVILNNTQDRPNAIEPGEVSTVLWAESPDEARGFLRRARQSTENFQVEKIFVAKKTPESRLNSYVGGKYYKTSNDEDVDVYNDVVIAPSGIINLVQWCTCDIMLSCGEVPRVVVECTSHLVRMNLYQRFPRLARAAKLGVPGLVLQGTGASGLDFKRRGDLWALYRYLQPFEATTRLHPNSPVLPIWYKPSEDEEKRAQTFLFEHISAIFSGDRDLIEAQRAEVISGVRKILSEGVDGAVPPDLPSVNYKGSEVIVRIGAKPDKPSWRTKGSGQMDTYVGLILAAKYIYCYDSNGTQTKPLVVEFTYLPKGFWFFQDANTTSLYKRLPIEFADEVRFLG